VMSDRDMRAAWGPPDGPGWGEDAAPRADVRPTPARTGAAAPGAAVPVARRRGSRRRGREPRLRSLEPLLFVAVLAGQGGPLGGVCGGRRVLERGRRAGGGRGWGGGRWGAAPRPPRCSEGPSGGRG